MCRKFFTCGYYDSAERFFAREVHVYKLKLCSETDFVIAEQSILEGMPCTIDLHGKIFIVCY